MVLTAVLMVCTAFQCEDEPLEGIFLTDSEIACLDAEEQSDNALNDFIEADDANYTELCNAYKDALENKIEVCGDPNGSVQNTIDGLGDCTE